jgi:MFS family permease
MGPERSRTIRERASLTGYVRAVADQRGAHRAALENRSLVRYSASHLLAINAEWAIFLALLVYTYDRSGARATGLASVMLLLPYVLAAPFAGHLTDRRRPSHVRFAGMAIQTVGYGLAAIAVYQDYPVWVAVVSAMFALGAITALAPAGAVLLPAMVRSSRELTVANLWTGYAESASELSGPIIATALLAIDGAPLVVAGSAFLAAVATAIAWFDRSTDPPSTGEVSDEGPLRSALTAARALRRRPGAFGVLAVAGGQFFLVGALDLIIVVAAADVLDMGDSGPGVLSTAFGVGAILSVGVTTLLIRRERLAGALLTLSFVLIAISLLFGASMTIVTAVIALPLLGLSRASLELLGRMMLQRSAPPSELGQIFTLLEIAGGVALIVGALAAQILIVISGPQAAMLGTGVFFALLLIAAASALRHADAEADVPVVAMSLFRRDPVLEPLPAIELEVVARTATEVRYAAGDVVIREGDAGDRYYVVADGELEITRSGEVVRVVERGGGFGEVALLADVRRTASVTATTDCELLAIDRVPFLRAITGHDASQQAAWGVVHAMGQGHHLPDA